MDVSTDDDFNKPTFFRVVSDDGKAKRFLCDRIKLGLTEDQAKMICINILDIIRYFHDTERLWRAVACNTIILDKFDRVVEVDVSISDVLTSSPDGEVYSSKKMGEYNYMGPEIFRTGHHHGKTFDFFALGVVVHRMLTDDFPYDIMNKEIRDKLIDCCRKKPEFYEPKTLEKIRKFLIKYQTKKCPIKNSEKLSPLALDFIQNLLITSPKYRLGSEGIEEIYSHPWLRSIVESS